MNKRRRTISLIAAVLLFIAGLILLLYPLVSDYAAKAMRRTAMDAYLNAADHQSEGELSADLLAAKDYNMRLVNSATVLMDPFDPNSSEVRPEEYNDILNPAHNGVMGILTIPKIQVVLPIYHGTSDEALQKGVGHLENTSLPVGGPSTHAVLTGHTGLPEAHMFDDLTKLEVGDTFTITAAHQTAQYEVYSIETVLPEETESLRIQEGQDLVTLVTCTPYGINTHRLLVHARRTDLTDTLTSTATYVDKSFDIPLFYFWLFICLLALLLIIIFVRLWLKKKKRTEDEGASAALDTLSAQDAPAVMDTPAAPDALAAPDAASINQGEQS